MKIMPEFKHKKLMSAQLKSRREKKGVSQEIAYKESNVNFARLETGRSSPTPYTLYRACKYLGTSEEELYSRLYK